jgi:hypothetical protein
MSPTSSIPSAAAATDRRASLSRSVPPTIARCLPFAPTPCCSQSDFPSAHGTEPAGIAGSDLRFLIPLTVVRIHPSELQRGSMMGQTTATPWRWRSRTRSRRRRRPADSMSSRSSRASAQAREGAERGQPPGTALVAGRSAQRAPRPRVQCLAFVLAVTCVLRCCSWRRSGRGLPSVSPVSPASGTSSRATPSSGSVRERT